MPKWVLHRPGTQSKVAKRGSGTSEVSRSRVGRKPSPGRWVLHDPETIKAPEGHGWHFDDYEPSWRGIVGERWTCDYGCKSFVWPHEPQPGQYHAWDCPYWWNEGRDLTPF